MRWKRKPKSNLQEAPQEAHVERLKKIEAQLEELLKSRHQQERIEKDIEDERHLKNLEVIILKAGEGNKHIFITGEDVLALNRYLRLLTGHVYYNRESQT